MGSNRRNHADLRGRSDLGPAPAHPAPELFHRTAISKLDAHPNRHRGHRVSLHRLYNSVDAVREELTRIVGQSQNWDGKVCTLQVTNATERTLELSALASAIDGAKAWDLRCEIARSWFFSCSGTIQKACLEKGLRRAPISLVSTIYEKRIDMNIVT